MEYNHHELNNVFGKEALFKKVEDSVDIKLFNQVYQILLIFRFIKSGYRI